MKRSKHGLLVFPPKKTLICKRHCSISQSCCSITVKAKYRLISRKFFGHEVFIPERSLNQPKATRVCIRSTNQSNRSISVLFARFHFKVIRKSLYSQNGSFEKAPHRQVEINYFRGFFRVVFWYTLSGRNYFIYNRLNLFHRKER